MINGHGDDMHCFSRAIVSNFSSNVYAKLDNSALKHYIVEHLNFIDFYPEPEAESLQKALAKNLNLAPEEVGVTNGATEAIYLIAQAFAQAYSVILQPTFSEYGDACTLHHHRVKSIYRLQEVPAEADICWLCNPNNPTGEVYDKSLLKELVTTNEKILFVIDQSYEAFTMQALFTAEEAAAYPNVILLHSMTKECKMAGLRLGYLTANTFLIERIRKQRMPWSVNNIALLAGHFRLMHPQQFDLLHYLQETQRLKKGLEGLGAVEVWKTDTHILLCQLRLGKAAALKRYLVEEHGILIRDAANFEGLNDTFFRIATQSPEENEVLIQSIAQWIALF